MTLGREIGKEKKTKRKKLAFEASVLDFEVEGVQGAMEGRQLVLFLV